MGEIMSRNVVLNIAMSLDGYIAKKDGNIDWLTEGIEFDGDNDLAEFIASIDTVIMGRKTYDQVLTFGDYPYKGLKGYVYTSEKRENTEDVEFIDGNVSTLIEKLKKEDGKDIWLIGGAGIIDNFVKKDLVDKYIIAIMPHILGEGIPLFKENNPEINLKLIKNEAMKGFAMLHYVKR